MDVSVSATMTRVASERNRTVTIVAERGIRWCNHEMGERRLVMGDGRLAITFEVDLEQVIGILSLCIACNLLQTNVLLLEELVSAPNTKHRHKESDT
jgi:hypothetical protein